MRSLEPKFLLLNIKIEQLHINIILPDADIRGKIISFLKSLNSGQLLFELSLPFLIVFIQV
jgi:hypothetical protein